VTPPGGAGARFTVRLTPRGGLDRIDGVRDGALHARVAAPPADGAANHALVRLLARELDVPASAVRLVAGASGRTKVIAIDGVGPARVLERWPALRL
jgi:hypothetical protein